MKLEDQRVREDKFEEGRSSEVSYMTERHSKLQELICDLF